MAKRYIDMSSCMQCAYIEQFVKVFLSFSVSVCLCECVSMVIWEKMIETTYNLNIEPSTTFTLVVFHICSKHTERSVHYYKCDKGCSVWNVILCITTITLNTSGDERQSIECANKVAHLIAAQLGLQTNIKRNIHIFSPWFRNFATSHARTYYINANKHTYTTRRTMKNGGIKHKDKHFLRSSTEERIYWKVDTIAISQNEDKVTGKCASLEMILDELVLKWKNGKKKKQSRRMSFLCVNVCLQLPLSHINLNKMWN